MDRYINSIMTVCSACLGVFVFQIWSRNVLRFSPGIRMKFMYGIKQNSEKTAKQMFVFICIHFFTIQVAFDYSNVFLIIHMFKIHILD